MQRASLDSERRSCEGSGVRVSIISLRVVVEAEEVDPDSVTAAIVRLVLAFSHTHGDLEAMFGGAHGLRAIAEEKRLQLVASDRPN